MPGRLLTLIAVLAWSILVITDYLVHHNYAVATLTSLPNPGLTGFIAACAGLAAFWYTRSNKSNPTETTTLPYRGLTAYLAVQFFSAAVMVSYSSGTFVKGVSGLARAGYFFGYSTLFLAGLFIILTAAYCLGNLVTGSLRERLGKGHKLVSLAFGFSILGLPLVLLGLANSFNLYACWGLIVVAIAARWRAALFFVTDTLWTRRQVNFGSWWSPAALVLLLAVTGFNLIAAFKTFPIGYDGSGLYVNLANLMADTGGLPFGGQAYGWSVMMAFGQTLFGDLSVAILMAHLMNVLCVLMVYRLARLWLSNDFALLAALIPLLSPYFAFHGIVDEKVDLAFTFIVLAGIYLAARTLVQTRNPKEASEVRVPLLNRSLSTDAFSFLLLGWLAGYAFTIKYTAIFFVIALTVWLFQRHGGKWGYLAAVAISLGVIFLSGISRLGYLDLTGTEELLLGAGLMLSGIAGLWFAFRHNVRSLTTPVVRTGLMALTFIVAFSPWAVKHLAEHTGVSISNMIEGRERRPALNYIPSLSHRTRDNIARPMFTSFQEPSGQARARLASQQGETQQRDGRNATEQAAREEIQRYLGYEAYFWRYASLPNDLNSGINISNGRFVDPGFLFLLFLPLLLFAVGRARPPLWRGALFAMLILIAMAGSYYAIYASPTGLFTPDAARAELQNLVTANGTPTWLAGLHALLSRPVFALTGLLAPVFVALGDLTLLLTLLVIFGVFTVVALPASRRFAGVSSGLSGFAGFMAVYALLWWILGNGVLWYALPLFVAGPILILSFLEKPEHLLGPDLSSFSRYFGGTVLSLFILLNTLLYFTSQYPGEQDAASLLRSPFVEVITDPDRPARKAVDKFNPVISEAMRIMNADRSEKIYRVNTHYGFLIAENDTRVYSDPTLETYDNIASRLADNSKFFDMLKAQGYRYIFFDLRTASLDQTPEKTLAKKCISLGRELTTSPKVRMLVTDNYIADPAAPVIRLPNGKTANARFGIDGQTVSQGNVVLFEIL